MYGFLVRVFKTLDYCGWFSIDEMSDLAIYANYSKYLGMHWKDTKRILGSLYDKIDALECKSVYDFEKLLSEEEKRVFGCHDAFETVRMRSTVHFLTGGE